MAEEFKKFHLELDDPVVVALQPSNEERVWGRWQFPALQYTKHGQILASFAYGKDDVSYSGYNLYMISEDKGKTWHSQKGEGADKAPNKNAIQPPKYTKMSNGKCFAGFVSKGAYKADYIEAYTHIYYDGERKCFLADDIAEEVDQKVFAREYDPVTGKTETFECNIIWPNMPLTVYNDNVVYPITMIFALSNEAGIHVIDGDLYFLLYWPGLDCEEKDRARLSEKAGPHHAYIFKSSDCGRTWELYSQLLADKLPPEIKGDYEGYSEPHMAKMPDGSWIMLIRTGCNRSSLIAKSFDNCKTWTKPKEFDTIGVLPQLLTLGCGVTLSSYGRPELRVRATSDPSGEKWEDPITIELHGKDMIFWNISCFYTQLLPLDDSSALLIYSDFHYPDADGNKVKAILTRRIRVIME